MKAQHFHVRKQDPTLGTVDPGAGDVVVVAHVAVQDQASLVVKSPVTKLTRAAFGMLLGVVLVELGLVRVDVVAELALVPR